MWFSLMIRLTFAVGGRMHAGDHALSMLSIVFDQKGTMRPIVMFQELPKN